MALAGGRCQVVQPLNLPGAQLDAIGSGVLLDARDPLGTGDRGDVVALREQPGQSDLGRCCTRLGGNGLDLVDDAQVALEVLAGEARVGLPPIVAQIGADDARLTKLKFMKTCNGASVSPRWRRRISSSNTLTALRAMSATG